jgi:hypothetical protein
MRYALLLLFAAAVSAPVFLYMCGWLILPLKGLIWKAQDALHSLAGQRHGHGVVSKTDRVWALPARVVVEHAGDADNIKSICRCS